MARIHMINHDFQYTAQALHLESALDIEFQSMGQTFSSMSGSFSLVPEPWASELGYDREGTIYYDNVLACSFDNVLYQPEGANEIIVTKATEDDISRLLSIGWTIIEKEETFLVKSSSLIAVADKLRSYQDFGEMTILDFPANIDTVAGAEYSMGYSLGYDEGYNYGASSTYDAAWQDGYYAGLSEAGAQYDLGYSTGYDEGVAAGREEMEGQLAAEFELGYQSGRDSGRSEIDSTVQGTTVKASDVRSGITFYKDFEVQTGTMPAGATLTTKTVSFTIYRGSGTACHYTGVDTNGNPVQMTASFGLNTSVSITCVVGTLVYVDFSAQELWTDDNVTELYSDYNNTFVGKVI